MRRMGLIFISIVFLWQCGVDYNYSQFKKLPEFLQATQKLYKEYSVDKTPLAIFKGGIVSRQDLVSYCRINYGLEAVVGSVNRVRTLFSALGRQKLLIREIIEKKILLREADRINFIKKDFVAKKIKNMNQKLLIPIHYRDVIIKNIKFNKLGLKVGHIFFRFNTLVKKDKREIKFLNVKQKAIYQKASKLYRQLKAGAAFENLARKYSDEYTKSQGGLVGWLVDSSFGDKYWQNVKKVGLGGFSEPFILNNGVYIVKVYEKKRVTPNNFEDLLHSRFAYSLRMEYEKKAKNDVLKRLYRERDVLINKRVLMGKMKNGLVARVGKFRVMKPEFENQFGQFIKGHKIGSFSKEKQLVWRMRFLKKFYTAPALIIRDSLRKKLDLTDEYKKAVKANSFVRSRVLFLEMKDYIIKTLVDKQGVKGLKFFYDKFKVEKYYTLKKISEKEAKKLDSKLVVKKKEKYFKKVISKWGKLSVKNKTQLLGDYRFFLYEKYIQQKIRAIKFRIVDNSKFTVLRFIGSK